MRLFAEAREGEVREWPPGNDSPAPSIAFVRFAIHPRGSLVVLQDPASVGRRLARRLYSQQRDAATRLATTIAHDFRNALAGIVYNIETLVEEDDAIREDLRRACLDDSLRSAHRLEELIAALLEHANAGSRVPVSVEALLARVSARLRRLFRHTSHRLEVHCEDSAAAFYGNLVAVEEAVARLVENALESAVDPLVVRLEGARKQGGAVRLAVVDDGGGIDPAIRGRVFEPFFTTKRGAAGMGLTLAREAIESMGGTLTLEHPDRGCIAIVELIEAPNAEGAS
jgi:signal transduction histidine kinase